MKCERCGVDSKGYALHDYCAVCSKNLCAECMAKGSCSGSKHQPASHGEVDSYDPMTFTCPRCTAQPGKPCYVLSSPGNRTKHHPHPARVDAARKVSRP